MAWVALSLLPLPGAAPLPFPADRFSLVGLLLTSLALDWHSRGVGGGKEPAARVSTSVAVLLAVVAPLAGGRSLLQGEAGWGLSGWLSSAIQMTTTNQNPTQVNIRHSAKLGATIAVYGTHCQIFYRTLVDSKADPSLGSWTSEALVDSGNDDCEGNFGGPQVAIDESSGDVHAFKAVTGSNGASWSGVTYWHGTMGSSGTITWSSRLIVDGSGTSSTNPPDIAGAVDSSGKVYIFWATSVSGVVRALVGAR